jgi:fatty-acyl-CoA synthase
MSEMHLTDITIAYGMTETSPRQRRRRGIDDPLDKRVATVGRVHPHVEVKIIDRRPAASCRAGSRASSAPAATR